MALNNTLLRVLTALALIPLVLALVLWAPHWLYASVAGAFALVAMWEYIGMAHMSGLAPLPVIPYAALIALLVWPAAAGDFLVLAAILVLGFSLRAARPLEKVLPGGAATVFGIVYIGLPFALLVSLRTIAEGSWWVIYVLVITWISDTAAYFVGKAFGKEKLAPRISPGKTWEGTAASLVAAAAFSVFYLNWMIPAFGIAWAVLAGVVVNAAGQIGDLAESAMKRGAGVKDSSAILPGHGGILDRIDALLFAVPALWYILRLRI